MLLIFRVCLTRSGAARGRFLKTSTQQSARRTWWSFQPLHNIRLLGRKGRRLDLFKAFYRLCIQRPFALSLHFYFAVLFLLLFQFIYTFFCQGVLDKSTLYSKGKLQNTTDTLSAKLFPVLSHTPLNFLANFLNFILYSNGLCWVLVSYSVFWYSVQPFLNAVCDVCTSSWLNSNTKSKMLHWITSKSIGDALNMACDMNKH